MRKLIGGNYGFKRTYRIKNNFFIRNSDNLFPSGRSAFISLVEYLFKKNNLSKIEIPTFLCESIAQSLHRYNFDYSFYSINKKFELKPKLKKDTITLLVNLFGMNDENIKKIVKNNSGQSFIIDMTHSILNKNFSLEKKENTEIFFSLRKFSPVMAGMSSIKNMQSVLNSRYLRLFKDNIELKKKRYKYFKLENKPIDIFFENKMIRQFSNHEKKLKRIFHTKVPKIMPVLLNGINWNEVRRKRKNNFLYLTKKIKKKFKIINLGNLRKSVTPMFLVLDLGKHRDNIKKFLFSKRILTPVHWPKSKFVNYRNFKVEKKMTETLLSIPIDQRYNYTHMELISKNLLKY